MQQHASTYYALTHTLEPWGLGQRSKHFLKVVMLHIKLKGMEHRAHATTYSVLTHTLVPCGGVKGQNNLFFLNVVMLQIKLKEMEHRAKTWTLTPP